MFQSSIFTTREIAIFIWVIIGVTAALFSASIRPSIWQMLKSLFDWKIIRIWLLMVVYISGFTYLFDRLNLWDEGLLKDTIFWVLFSGSVTFFKVNRISEDKNFFKELLKENIKAGIFFEFVIALYTFNFWIEFIIVPVTVLIAGMIVFSEKDEKYFKVKKLLNSIVIIAGLVVIYHVVLAVIRHFHSLISLENLSEILLSPVLTIIYIPFIYLLSLIMVYEVQFIIIERALKMPEINTYAKLQAMLRFNTDTDGLKRWAKRLWRIEIKSKNDLKQSILNLKNQQLVEESPPVISREHGWSPFAAVHFMENETLTKGFYEPLYDNEWSFCSDYLLFGDKYLSNSLSYYITGTQEKANKLELVLKVMYPGKIEDLHKTYMVYCEMLFEKAVLSIMPQKISNAIFKGSSTCLNYGNYELSLTKEKWHNLTHGYDLLFSIKLQKPIN